MTCGIPKNWWAKIILIMARICWGFFFFFFRERRNLSSWSIFSVSGLQQFGSEIRRYASIWSVALAFPWDLLLCTIRRAAFKILGLRTWPYLASFLFQRDLMFYGCLALKRAIWRYGHWAEFLIRGKTRQMKMMLLRCTFGALYKWLKTFFSGYWVWIQKCVGVCVGMPSLTQVLSRA